MSDELLTEHELKASELLGDLVNVLVLDMKVSGKDQQELVSSIHNIQRAIMGQAAARAYPEKFRLLHGTV